MERRPRMSVCGADSGGVKTDCRPSAGRRKTRRRRFLSPALTVFPLAPPASDVRKQKLDAKTLLMEVSQNDSL